MKRKDEQLGMPHGTATAQLRKEITFSLLQKLGLAICFRCNAAICTSKELSMDHKVPWLDAENPKELFFDIENVAWSHLSCNIAAARKPTKKYFTVEERQAATRKSNAQRMRKWYTSEKRRAKYLRSGY